MLPSPSTLILAIIVSALIVAALLGSAHGYLGRFRGVSAWAVATLIQATGWFFFGTLRGTAPELFVILAGNGLIHLSLARYLLIVAEFEGKPVRASWAYGTVLAMLLGLVYFTLESPSVAARIAIASACGATLTLASARVLTQGTLSRPRSHWFSASMFAICGLFLVFRAGYYFVVNTDPSYAQFADNTMNRASLIIFLTTLFLLNVGFLFMLSERYSRERAEEWAALERSLRAHGGLTREANDRVEDNLRAMLSLMSLSKGGDPEADTRTALKDMRARLRAVMSGYEASFGAGNHARVNLADYLLKVATDLFEARTIDPAVVRLVLALEPVELETRQAVPCALVVHELVSNSLKHGFADGRAGEVRIGLRQDPDRRVWLLVGDTGIGFPASFAFLSDDSPGLQLVSDLARQLEGRLGLEPPATVTLDFIPAVPDTVDRTDPKPVDAALRPS